MNSSIDRVECPIVKTTSGVIVAVVEPAQPKLMNRVRHDTAPLAHAILCRAEPLCMAMCSVLSLLISYCGSVAVACRG